MKRTSILLSQALAVIGDPCTDLCYRMPDCNQADHSVCKTWKRRDVCYGIEYDTANKDSYHYHAPSPSGVGFSMTCKEAAAIVSKLGETNTIPSPITNVTDPVSPESVLEMESDEPPESAVIVTPGGDGVPTQANRKGRNGWVKVAAGGALVAGAVFVGCKMFGQGTRLCELLRLSNTVTPTRDGDGGVQGVDQAGDGDKEKAAARQKKGPVDPKAASDQEGDSGIPGAVQAPTRDSDGEVKQTGGTVQGGVSGESETPGSDKPEDAPQPPHLLETAKSDCESKESTDDTDSATDSVGSSKQAPPGIAVTHTEEELHFRIQKHLSLMESVLQVLRHRRPSAGEMRELAKDHKDTYSEIMESFPQSRRSQPVLEYYMRSRQEFERYREQHS